MPAKTLNPRYIRRILNAGGGPTASNPQKATAHRRYASTSDDSVIFDKEGKKAAHSQAGDNE